MIRLAIPRASMVAVGMIGAFAPLAGFLLNGGRIPGFGTPPGELVVGVVAALGGIGIFSVLLRHPDTIGRVWPSFYALIAVLPLLRVAIPAIDLLRFLPLALLAPVAYSLYRTSKPLSGHSRLAGLALFAAFATGASSLVANRAETDNLRLALMVLGIVLLVWAAPRAWPTIWFASVARAMTVVFWFVVLSSALSPALGGATEDGRLRGIFFSAITVGALLALATPLAAERSRFPPAYWALAFALTIACGSRGGLLALTAALIVVLVAQRRFLVIAAVALLGALALSVGVVRTQSSSEITSGVNPRALIWDEVLDEARTSIVVGHGFGSFVDFDFSPRTELFAGAAAQTHNSWLDALYEQGLLGLLPWLAVLAGGIAAAARAGSPWLATLLAGLISATFESWMFALGGGTGALFWMVLGAASLGAAPRAKVGSPAGQRPNTADSPAVFPASEPAWAAAR